jgi:acyl-CoA synthetase (AMP-forming)/AMP-acid ligase II
MFDAYVSPWRSRADVLTDGWFDTGDVGYLDAEGCLFILGRAKNVINFAGTKIFPYETEAAIAQHPAVEACLVYGEAHPLYGQVPCARIVLKAGVVAPDLNELRRFCCERLALHKVPRSIEIVAELALTPSGKIKRA